ncbi:MAG: aldo/keto reductase [Deltaproteobacteria bacterium]|nr:aldo/keto reductase [Deltaproteobacteria bacterium]
MAKKEIDRREFITDFSIKLAGTGLLLNQIAACATSGGKSPAAKKDKGTNMEYRTLGKTGLKVSAVSFGVMRLKEPAVLFKAFDLGINFFDTAHNYQNGNNEIMLGKAAKEYGRKKILIATKIHPFHLGQTSSGNFRLLERKAMDEMMEKSLKRLQTDYVDVLLIHNIMDTSWPLNETVVAFLEKLKKEGKARFVGISIHDPRYYVNVVDQVAKSPIYDVVLAWFNFKSDPEHMEALKRARKKNVGIIAMKTQAGGYEKGATASLSPQQAALKWVLDKDYVDCAIPGMVNNEQLLENVGVIGKKVSWSDRKVLHAYYNSVKQQYCIMCGKCFSTCSNNIDINAVNRALMYCEGYGDFEQGRRTYLALGKKESGLSCISCSSPTCHCFNGIKIAERMRHAHSLFA